MSATIIARNRFGLGARAGEPRLDDPRGWLLDQIDGEPPGLDGAPTKEEASAVQLGFVRAARAQDQDALERARRDLFSIAMRETDALFRTRVGSERPFAERWVAFWSNHLCVSAAANPRLIPLSGAYEREAIRPHALRSFEEMLLASARHPAMLIYLDNAQSIGPGSMVARLGGRRRRGNGSTPGLNENYARELLELHTVGVDGGYGQADVEQLARILTGWTIEGAGGPLDRSEGPIAFRFRPALHEPGAKTVMGVRYPEAGEEEGVRAIRDLARRPETARFLSTKLVRHFVDDDPPAAAVDRVEARWRETDGDLRQVATAVVELEQAWDPAHRKFRTPQDWLVAVLRSVGARTGGRQLLPILDQLRHRPWAPPSPKGYSDLTRDWADPDSLMNRAELSRSLADRGAPRSRDLPRLVETVDVGSTDPLVRLVSDESVPVTERLALVFASPAFQWR